MAARDVPVAVLGTCDTKGTEIAYLADEVRRAGARPVIYDAGVHGPQGVTPDVPATAVAAAAGLTLPAVAALSRGEAVAAMGRGLHQLLAQAWWAGEVVAAVAAGGSGGTSIAATAMAALPVGAGKLIVSTVAAGDVRAYVGTRDITLMPAVVDVAGLNRISRAVLRNAGRAVAAMALAGPPPRAATDGPLLAATMFGVTTPAVTAARIALEAHGAEVLVFHATGTGGRAMEALVDDGQIDGVLDLTTTEWADEVVGGALSAGPDRLRAPGRRGIPHVVAPGAVDMVNFGAVETVPQAFRGRLLHAHNPQVTLMRTTVAENRAIARAIAAALNASAGGPTVVLLPMGGFSALDSPGQPFWDPEADRAFAETVAADLDPRIPVRAIDLHINDPAFAAQAVATLEDLLAKRRSDTGSGRRR